MRLTAKGFTLVELLVTVSLVGILAAIAIPNFSSTLQNNKADTEVSNLQRALNYARLEAINRGVTVRIAPAAGNNWTTELRVFRASDVNASSPPIFRSVPAMSAGAALVSNPSATALEFNNLGGLTSPGTAVTMTYTRGSITKTLNVCLTGRIVLGTC